MNEQQRDEVMGKKYRKKDGSMRSGDSRWVSSIAVLAFTKDTQGTDVNWE